MGAQGNEAPVLRPTREQFSRPFAEYIEGVFKKHPDVAMFRVVPPRGWKPRRKPFPSLKTIMIDPPIKQHCFGTKGAYRCYLVEQKPLSAFEFREIANDDEHTPSKKNEDEAHMERAFWSSMTINPPLYGADTPQSFFDEELEWGWNLHNLGCLLSTCDVRSCSVLWLYRALACCCHVFHAYCFVPITYLTCCCYYIAWVHLCRLSFVRRLSTFVCRDVLHHSNKVQHAHCRAMS